MAKGDRLGNRCLQDSPSAATPGPHAIGAQLQKAAVSIPANVAEGWARGPGRSYPFFLRVAIGSEAELQTELEIAIRAGVVDEAIGAPLIVRTAEVGRMLNGLLSAVNYRELTNSRRRRTHGHGEVP